MQIRLYMDEDAMSRALVNGLRARGIDVATVGEEGRTGLKDVEQLAFAASQERVLYTFNVSDFHRIHTEYLAQGRSHAGIILVPQQRYSVSQQLRRLLILIRSRSAESMKDNIQFLSNWG